MNELIDQLWGQALDQAVPETYSQLSHSQVLKVKQVFAELIVQECAQHALDFNTNIQSLPDKVMRANLYRVLDYIKDRMELNNE